jgi:hypothetical protein
LIFKVVSFLQVFPPKPCTLSSPLPCLPHAPHTSLSLPSLPNDNWGRVKFTKLLIVKLPQLSCYFILLWFKYSQNPVSNTLSLWSSLNVADHVTHTHTKQLAELWFCMYILTFTFLDSRREDKRLWTEW